MRQGCPSRADHPYVPTHDVKPTGFDAAQKRRQAEAEAAFERARAQRAAEAIAKLLEREARHSQTSIPPPGR